MGRDIPVLTKVGGARVKCAVTLGWRLRSSAGPVGNWRHVATDARDPGLVHDATLIHLFVWLQRRTCRPMTGLALVLRCACSLVYGR